MKYILLLTDGNLMMEYVVGIFLESLLTEDSLEI
jgi:hypothetical protein